MDQFIPIEVSFWTNYFKHLPSRAVKLYLAVRVEFHLQQKTSGPMSVSHLAKISGLSPATVQKAVNELEHFKLIHVKHKHIAFKPTKFEARHSNFISLTGVLEGEE